MEVLMTGSAFQPLPYRCGSFYLLLFTFVIILVFDYFLSIGESDWSPCLFLVMCVFHQMTAIN